MLEISKRADLKEIVKLVGDVRLSFGIAGAPDGVARFDTRWVSPFGLINDAAGSVRVLIDQDLKGADRLIFHPNINTASVVVSWADLERFIATRSNSVRLVGIP